MSAPKKKSRFEKSDLVATEPNLKALAYAYEGREDGGYGVGNTLSVAYSSMDEYKDHEGDFGAYMATKRAKLVIQKRREDLESSLFQNLVVFIDGHTAEEPPDRLQELVCSHGGLVENTFTTSVTHIVCDNLAGSKMRKLLGGGGRKRKVVSPRWILDSIRRGKLVEANDYSLLPRPSNVIRKSPLKKRRREALVPVVEQTLFTRESCRFDHVCDSLALWMSRNSNPNEKDAVLLVELLAVNVVAGKLDDVACFLRLLDAMIDNEKWSRVSKLVADLAKHMVSELYDGATLVHRALPPTELNSDEYHLDR